MPTINLYLDDELYIKLAHEAMDRKLSVSKIIQEALLEKYMPIHACKTEAEK